MQVGDEPLMVVGVGESGKNGKIGMAYIRGGQGSKSQGAKERKKSKRQVKNTGPGQFMTYGNLI